jgi:lipoprotein signal peptidase
MPRIAASALLAGHKWALPFTALVCADQITKAMNPWTSLDPDTGSWMPAFVRGYFRYPDTRHIINGVGALVLITLGVLVTRRVRGMLPRAGAVILLAGLTSNLLDRLGMARLTQGIDRCVVINWFRIGVGRVLLGNLADVCYAAGLALLVLAVARAGGRALRRRRLHLQSA